MSEDSDSKPLAASYRPRSRRCCIFTVAGITLAVILILAIAIPVAIKNSKSKSNNAPEGQAAVNAACLATSYPDACNQTLAGSAPSDATGYTKMQIKAATESVNTTKNIANQGNMTDDLIAAAAEVCNEVLDDAYDQLTTAFEFLANNTNEDGTFDSIKAYVSAAQEDVQTCLEAFLELAPSSNTSNNLQTHGYTVDALISNVLCFVNNLAEFGNDVTKWANIIFNMPDGFNVTALTDGVRNIFHRRLLNEEASGGNEDTPGWMDSASRRRLLAANPYNVMVAADGSGKYRRIMDAINNAPKYKGIYTIYVKSGRYNEQVIIPKQLTNLVIYGDGQGKTVLTGSRNVALQRGMTTFKSATMIVSASRFVGKYFTVENTAGSAGHQAVAVRVSADKVSFFRCTFDSFQDTLYAHTFRQYYRECTVMGTVDFIFGNGAVVFQSCDITAKLSTLIGQQNTYTAQGRTDPHQPTGLSFQDCNFLATPDLQRNTKIFSTFLGRPWKAYSVCVHLRSTLQSHISPQGWMPWNTTNFGLYTSFFAEYQSQGPAAGTSQRVKWSHQITNKGQANNYQALKFIDASRWVPAAGLPVSLNSV